MERYKYDKADFSLMERSAMPFAVYQLVNKRVTTLILSQGFLDLFGYTDREQAYIDMDNDMYKDTHPDDAARIADAAFVFATKGGDYNVIYRSLNKDRTGYNIIHAMGKHLYMPDGTRLAQVWYTDEGFYTSDNSKVASSELTQTLKNALFEESLLKASYYDHLTGLPGMTYFFELAAVRHKELRREGFQPTMLFMDFSGMKYFNHKHGFAEGDKLLKDFARLIAHEFGNENCSRLGQDHYAAITIDINIEQKLKDLFEKCKLLNNGHSLPLHVGIYAQWFDGIVASMACDRAKFACDTLRNVYSSEFIYYNMSMKDSEDRQQYIIANIDKAIEEGWITVYYQPIVRAVNGRVCDEEALARWIDPVNGFMSPADFIPVLEDHKLIYKLDLYIVECVLKKIKVIADAGLHLMPQSVNLSRSDFESCDIVEEIKRRVDEAGVSRSMLTIEITESIIGRDFEFMKSQIDRFREEGFAVWMDDFGSGYSSLDVLQSIKFDLIKFDMRFLQKFGDDSAGNASKIILTELLKMATSLGIDTICEGVETQEQAQFLQEAGCSKLQGYYFDKPIPVEKILEKYEKGIQIGFENPDESQYFEKIGRVNLYDLSVIAQGNFNDFDNFYNALPMAIIELNDGQVRFMRSNQTYRDFMYRNFFIKIDNTPEPFRNRADAAASPFMKALFKTGADGSTIYIDEITPQGTTVHSCLRRLAINPVSGTTAVAVAVLSVSKTYEGATYANIAMALAADYFNLYYVDLETDRFIEYSAEKNGDEPVLQRKGEDFFHASRKDALKFIYSEDREQFRAAFRKEKILKELNEHGRFTINYRLIMNGEPVYVIMKAMKMQDDPKHIIIGVSNVDAQMRQKLMLEKITQNELVFSRIMSLSDEYLCIYFVDAKTGKYTEYASTEEYKGLNLNDHGEDFFKITYIRCDKVIAPHSRAYFKENFTREKVMEQINKNGIFRISYDLLIGDRTVPIDAKGVLVTEDDGDKLIFGIQRRS